MKILLINTGPKGTGSFTVIEALMKKLRKENFQVMALFPDLITKKEDLSSDSSLKQIIFPASHRGFNFYTFPLIIPDPNPRNYKDAWTYKDLTDEELESLIDYFEMHIRSAVKEFKPDIIECQHIWLNSYICSKLGYDYISSAHNSDQIGFEYDKRMRKYAIEGAKNSKYIFTISDYVKDLTAELYDVSKEKIICIPNGYDQDVFHKKEINEKAFLSKFGLENPDNLPIINFCGKISKTKGIDVLLEANYIAQKKEKFLLLIAGSGDIESIELNKNKNYSFENAHFLGHISYEDLSSLHNISRFSTLPSRSEGFGIAALEAMGCEIPVIATNVGGLSNIISGKIIEPEEVYELAEAILELLNIPENEYNELCSNALQKAKKFSWESNILKRIEYYKKIKMDQQNT